MHAFAFVHPFYQNMCNSVICKHVWFTELPVHATYQNPNINERGKHKQSQYWPSVMDQDCLIIFFFQVEMNHQVLLKSITLNGFILSKKHLIRILKAPLRILCSTHQPHKNQGRNVIIFYVFKVSPLPPLPPIRSWNAWSQCNISRMADAVLMMTAGLSRNACRCRSLSKIENNQC